MVGFLVAFPGLQWVVEAVAVTAAKVDLLAFVLGFVMVFGPGVSLAERDVNAYSVVHP